uniref:cyclomaltodextrinase N-terminal domain-containing protein n=1 Tax=Prevotella heparinolytica TaxID=28113 RepID=UPI0035A1A047
MKHLATLILFLLTLAPNVWGRSLTIDHVHPLHWWTDMKQTELQILLHGKGVGKCQVALNAQGVTLLRTETTTNPNYLLLYVDTRNAAPQTFHIQLRGKGVKAKIPYTLKARTQRPVNSFTAADVVYLLMPDRFANGDLTNDNVPSMTEARTQPDQPFGRH